MIEITTDTFRPAPPPDDRLRLDIDPEELCTAVQFIVETTLAELSSGSLGDTLGAGCLAPLRDRLVEIQRRVFAPLTVVVIGEFKRGKSTLINALLGMPLAPTDVLPETITINSYVPADTFSAYLKLNDGTRVALEPEQLASERLRPLIDRSGRDAIQVQVHFPRPVEGFWLEEVVLIDTPGTGDLGSGVEDRVRACVRDADIVLVVISALSPLSASEQAMLRSVLAPHDFVKIAFVLNMIDMVPGEANRTRVTQRVACKIGRIFAGAALYPLSALHEIRRITAEGWWADPDGDDTRLAALFVALRRDLRETLTTRRSALILDRIIWLAEGALASSAADFDALDQALRRRLAERETDVMALNDKIDELTATHEFRRQALVATLNQLAEQAVLWMTDFVNRLHETLASQFTGLTAEQIGQDLPFFINDLSHSALEACLEAHRSQIECAATDAFYSGLQLPFSITPERSGAGFVFAPPQYSGRACDEVAFEQLIGGGVLVAIGTAMMESVQQSQSKVVEVCLDPLMPTVAAQVAATTRQAYQTLAERIDHLLTEDYAACRGRHETTRLQAAEFAERTSAEVAQACRDLERGRTILARKREDLAAIRRTLGEIG